MRSTRFILSKMEDDELHPIIKRTLSWFASSTTNNSSNSTDWHVSNWWHNNTFDYEEFNEDVADATSDLEDNLHPASDVDVNGVLSSSIFNAIVFFLLIFIYEILRKYVPYVYATRQSRQAVFESRRKNMGSESTGRVPLQTRRQSSNENLPDLYQSSTPLEWVKPVFGISWRQVREASGLDAYFFLRYIRMCFRITSVSAFWGVTILFPIFANGRNDAKGWYHYSMANVMQGSGLIWVPTLFMYLFSAFVFFIMKHEYKHFVELRLDFLGKGDGSSDPQHHYSIMVEQLPTDLRSEKALFDYFEQMFPGKVHSSNVILKLPEVEALSRKKLKITSRLEKSIARFEATGKRPNHVMGRPRLMLCGIELTTMDCLCWGSKKEPVMDFDDKDTVAKGEKVDSINYYTHQLKGLNKKMFIEQKKKRDIAENGNKSLMATSWFSKVSEYAELFMDDPNMEESSDESSVTDQGNESGHSVISEIDFPANEESLMHRFKSELTIGADFVQMENGKESSTLTITTPEAKREKKIWLVADYNAETALSHPSSNLSPNDPPSNNHYGSTASTPPGTKSKKRRFKGLGRNNKLKLEDGSSSSREEPLISQPTEETLKKSLQDRSGIIRYRRNQNRRIQTDKPKRQNDSSSCLPNERTTKRLSKFAGRFGLDFGAYATKLCHRFINRSLLDDEKLNEMSKTGFVTFLDLSAVTCVASAPLTHKPNTLEVVVAPEARDVLWQNSHYTSDLRKRRESNANNFLVVGALLWSIPLAFIQGVSSAENVAQIPGMDWILEYDNGNLKVFINAYLPVLALLGLILILPVIFEKVATSYEKRKTLSDIQQSIVGRYFYYQLANIYITVTAGSLWKSAADILARPSAGLEILGNSLPTVVGYFIALIITKILGGLPLVILRLGALSRYLLLRLITRDELLTQRELDQVYRAEPLLYGWEYPTQLLVIVICFTYACISPVILIFGAFYFVGALMVYKKQVLYVYSPSYESGGKLFPIVCDRTIVGLICGQLTFIGYSIIRGGHYQVSFYFLKYSRTIVFQLLNCSIATSTSTPCIF